MHVPPPHDAALWSRPLLLARSVHLAELVPQLQASGIPTSNAACLLAGLSESDALPERCAGLAVLGTASDLPTILTHVQPSVLVVSLPDGDRAVALAARDASSSAQVPCRVLLPLSEQLRAAVASTMSTGQGTAGAGPLNWADLIGRTSCGLDPKAVAGVLRDKRVLITGAGGSIGSEIARICAGFAPSLLVLMERSENALFEIDRAIAQRFPDVPRKALLHDVVEEAHTLRHLLALRPHTVFHAAAHKHVPLMEDHPSHAVSNNLFGTKAIADASVACGAERFVLVSTDKAVQPSSTMGATKRLAELYVQHLAKTQRAGTGTRCAIVRFGNVLGSACSVIPIWESQLSQGAPLTVTDERMTRFFMTIHEAATLVIQSSTLAGASQPSGSIFVLDMGQPVRILDLARRFAMLRGLTPVLPGQEVPDDARAVRIVYMGIRPGEKLHEALVYPAECLTPTLAPGINVLAGPQAHTEVNVPAMVQDLTAVRHHAERGVVRAALARVFPEFAEHASPRSGMQQTSAA